MTRRVGGILSTPYARRHATTVAHSFGEWGVRRRKSVGDLGNPLRTSLEAVQNESEGQPNAHGLAEVRVRPSGRAHYQTTRKRNTRRSRPAVVKGVE